MHGTDEKKPTGSSNSTAGGTDVAIVPDTSDTSKVFAVLAARLAMIGHTLTRSNPANGAGMFYAARWGMSSALPDLQAAVQFLAQIGGAQ